MVTSLSDQGAIMFKGSTHEHDWKIYHDRLSQWWEKEAQEYLESKGFKDRQWRASRSTNDTIEKAKELGHRNWKYYIDKLMGDTPELMPLDSSLFNDLIEATGKAVVSTKNEEDAKRYTMADPDNAWRTMRDMWTSRASSLANLE